MVSFKSIFVLGFVLGSSLTSAWPTLPRTPGCGEVDVLFTGLPPTHPLVKGQGFDPVMVNASLRADAAEIINAGYNLRVALFGPEQPISVLSDQLKGVNWDALGVGYGVRGSPLQNLTIRLEEIIQTYRDTSRTAPIVFNHSPTSGLWALQRNSPLSSNCTNSPGKDLGFNIICDIC